MMNKMNENLDLTIILKGCPNGTKLYSTIHGEVIFRGIYPDNYPIATTIYDKNENSVECVYFTKDGRVMCRYDGECILFPSKEQRDWSKFERFWDKSKIERFDVNTLQPFDKILARDSRNTLWSIEFFSHKPDNIARGLFSNWCYVIPYNEETKHLVGTRKDCPEYYKWWEE